MSAGWAALGRCFDSAASAAAYTCGSQWPSSSVEASTGAPVVVLCTSASDAGVTLASYRAGALVGTVSQPVAFGACDTLDWQQFYPFSFSATDGAAIGAAICTVWFAGWGWRMVYRLINSRSSDADASPYD